MLWCAANERGWAAVPGQDNWLLSSSSQPATGTWTEGADRDRRTRCGSLGRWLHNERASRDVHEDLFARRHPGHVIGQTVTERMYPRAIDHATSVVMNQAQSIGIGVNIRDNIGDACRAPENPDVRGRSPEPCMPDQSLPGRSTARAGRWRVGRSVLVSLVRAYLRWTLRPRSNRLGPDTSCHWA